MLFSMTMTRYACVLAVTLMACGGDGPTTGPPPTPFWVEDATDAVAGGTTIDGVVPVLDAVVADRELGDAVLVDAVPADTIPLNIAPAEETAYYVSVRVNREQTQDPSPFGSAWSESLTASVGLVQIVWKGDVGTRWEQVCAMWSNRVHGSQILYGAPFVDAIPVEPIEIVRSEGIYSEALDEVWLGLKQGYTGDLPALGESDHPALVDSDKDGEPGATLDIDMIVFGNQKIFVAQRSVTQWSASLQEDGRIVAEPSVTHERVTVGASVGVLVASTRTKPVTGKPADTMVWTRIENPISCADLLNDETMLGLVSWPPTVD
jgi:hypothetical protein